MSDIAREAGVARPTLYKHFKSTIRELGLPDIRFHDLRATWATIMLSKGVEPIKVMSMGGWKDIKTMMSISTDQQPDSLIVNLSS